MLFACYHWCVSYVIGVDEAGRGALAGPVCVGAVLIPSDFDWQEAFERIARGKSVRLRDSKQLSAQQRDILFAYIEQHIRIRFAFAFSDANIIDSIGIVNASHEAAALAIRRLGTTPEQAEVLLDAGLRAPSEWSQVSIIRGDETVPAIALASIVAKVSRDRMMEEAARYHTRYHFEEHKGYGTLEHRRAIRAAGLSPLHRVTFCSHLRIWSKSV